MAAANRGKCSKSVSLHELLEWPLVDKILLHIGLVSALNVMPQCSEYARACAGSRIPQASAGIDILWKCMLLCPHMSVPLFHWSQC